MTPEAGDILHPHPVYLPILMTTQTRLPVRPEGMDLPAMAVLAGKFLGEDVSCMTRRFVHADRTLGSFVPVAPCAGPPRGLVAMRFWRLAIRREHELYQQPVLFDHPQLMTVLAYDVPVP